MSRVISHPNLCASCGACCQSAAPQVDSLDLSRMISALGGELISAAGPVPINDGFFRFSTSGCPARGDNGCMITNSEDRPMVCRMYPLEPQFYGEGRWRVLLDVAGCKYWRTFGEHYPEAVEILREHFRRDDATIQGHKA